MRIFAVYDILLPVEEPRRDFELGGVLDNGNESFEFVRVKLSGAGVIV